MLEPKNLSADTDNSQFRNFQSTLVELKTQLETSTSSMQVSFSKTMENLQSTILQQFDKKQNVLQMQILDNKENIDKIQRHKNEQLQALQVSLQRQVAELAAVVSSIKNEQMTTRHANHSRRKRDGK